MSRRACFLLLASTSAAAALACGGLADPSRNASAADPGALGTISGALTGGLAPAGAHVALVWRKDDKGGLVVREDAPVVDDRFTLQVGEPPNEEFTEVKKSAVVSATPRPPDAPSGGVGGVSPYADASVSDPPATASDASDTDAPSTTPPQKPSAPATDAGPRLELRGERVGGQIAAPMYAAVAGLVLYVDKNQNGRLDVESPYGQSPDDIVGGDQELVLAYLRGGGTLDYEKLRDKAGFLPNHGLNVKWIEGKRWLPLDSIELKVSTSTKLPANVCDTEVTASVAAPSASGYKPPTKGDPNIHCATDGRSYWYDYPPCQPTSAPPPGLCTDVTAGSYACPSSVSEHLAPGQAFPPNWPCAAPDTDTAVVGHPVEDAGSSPHP